MASVRQCENCGRTATQSEAESWWFKIRGIRGPRDACSPDCAGDLLDAAIRLLRENQHAFAGEMECIECGAGPEAPCHWERGRPADSRRQSGQVPHSAAITSK